MRLRRGLADLLAGIFLWAVSRLDPLGLGEAVAGAPAAQEATEPRPASPEPAAEAPEHPRESLTLFADTDDIGYRLEAWIQYCAGMRRDLMPWDGASLADQAMANYCAAQWGLEALFGPVKPAREDGMAVEQRVRVASSVLRLMVERDREGLSVRVRVESPEETAANDALGVTLPSPARERGR